MTIFVNTGFDMALYPGCHGLSASRGPALASVSRDS